MYINQPFWQTIRELTPSPVCCFYYTRVTGNKLEINIIVPFISINKTVGRLQVNTFNLQKKKKTFTHFGTLCERISLWFGRTDQTFSSNLKVRVYWSRSISMGDRQTGL
jgi:hypothetical protein